MFENPINRLYNLFLVPNALMMMMSGFVLTTLIQREYQDHTMINVLTAPVARTKFIMSKLLAWFIWHFTTLVVVIIIFAVWYQFIFSGYEIIGNVVDYLRLGLFSFISMIPLIWIAIMQRRVFFPTIFLSFVLAGATVIISDGMLYNIIPWTAVPLVSFSYIIDALPVSRLIIGLISISATGILGLVLACMTFAKQDQ